ncbi:MAG: hypothetical protein RR547_02065 [Raoultibacter sp.]
MAKKDDYDWLDDPFNDHKNHKPQGGCSGVALVAVVLVFVLIIVLGFFVLGSVGAISDMFAG